MPSQQTRDFSEFDENVGIVIQALELARSDQRLEKISDQALAAYATIDEIDPKKVPKPLRKLVRYLVGIAFLLYSLVADQEDPYHGQDRSVKFPPSTAHIESEIKNMQDVVREIVNNIKNPSLFSLSPISAKRKKDIEGHCEAIESLWRRLDPGAPGFIEAYSGAYNRELGRKNRLSFPQPQPDTSAQDPAAEALGNWNTDPSQHHPSVLLPHAGAGLSPGALGAFCSAQNYPYNHSATPNVQPIPQDSYGNSFDCTTPSHSNMSPISTPSIGPSQPTEGGFEGLGDEEKERRRKERKYERTKQRIADQARRRRQETQDARARASARMAPESSSSDDDDDSDDSSGRPMRPRPPRNAAVASSPSPVHNVFRRGGGINLTGGNIIGSFNDASVRYYGR